MERPNFRRRLLAGALLSFTLPALADHGHGGDRGHGGGGDRGPGGGDRGGHGGHGGPPPGRGPERHAAPPDYWHDGPHGRWGRGERMPRDVRVVYVDDWRARGLRRPPPGHRWAYIDGEWLLIAVATGVIVDILLNH